MWRQWIKPSLLLGLGACLLCGSGPAYHQARGEPLKLSLAARRHVIRQRILASPFPELQQEADRVEAEVLSSGRYAVDLIRQPPVRAWLDPERWPKAAVMALQVPTQPSVVLLAYDLTALSMQPLSEPELYTELTAQAQACASGQCTGRSLLSLRGALKVQLQGLSQPVSLCSEPDAEGLDVTPCINPAALRIRSPAASLSPRGELRFIKQAALQQLLSLVRDQPSLSIAVEAADQMLVAIDLPIYFVRQEPLHFIGPRGGSGLSLQVWVDARDKHRLVFTVQMGGYKYLAAIDRAGTNHFSIVSSGGVGFPGPDGQAGGPGENGEDGGRGTAGGPGGDIRVQVACGAADCGEVIELLRPMIRSEGGPGGNGGKGGAGTPSSRGSGAYHVIILPASGRSGPDGPNGRTGYVRFTSGPEWAMPPPSIEPPASTGVAASADTIARVKVRLESAIAAQQGLLTACYRTYGKDEVSATARITIDSSGSVIGAQVDGVGSSLAVCVERVLKTLAIPPIREKAATVELPFAFSRLGKTRGP